MALTMGRTASLGSFVPGADGEYVASIAANVISTAGDATLSVSDPDPVMPGRLVNGDRALAHPLLATATNAAQPLSVFAPITGDVSPLVLLTYPKEIANDAVTVSLKQVIDANEALRSGTYSKTLTFTLSTTNP
jgi:hypothetical protein